MNPYWSALARELHPYVPGEQPRIADLVKLNTNESPYPPSPKALAAIRAAASDELRLYPDPQARRLRETLARYHGVDIQCCPMWVAVSQYVYVNRAIFGLSQKGFRHCHSFGGSVLSSS